MRRRNDFDDAPGYSADTDATIALMAKLSPWVRSKGWAEWWTHLSKGSEQPSPLKYRIMTGRAGARVLVPFGRGEPDPRGNEWGGGDGLTLEFGRVLEAKLKKAGQLDGLADHTWVIVMPYSVEVWRC